MTIPGTAQAARVLVRHAHAEWPDWRGRDFDRPLTPQGLDGARAAGVAMHAAGLQPRRMIASAAQRTTQTALILAEALQLPPEVLELRESLYNADVDALHAALQEAAAEGGTVLLVAHNPGISELARLLSGRGDLPYFRPADWRAF